MRINTRGVELTPPAEWIKEPGEYTFKITEWKQDGYTQNGDEKFKIFFKTGEGAQHSELFSTAANMLWKIKRLEVALGAPEEYDLDDLVGHYVTAIVGTRTHNGNQYAEVKEWRESASEKAAIEKGLIKPIKEAKSEEAIIAEEAEELF